ncbi:MAG: response regulator transcription factor [Firmicutes bacterium]|nr:response regulator transcription factor [Bacillota bacterium]
MSTPLLTRPMVLIVDDDAHIRELCQLYLQADGFNVLEANCGHAAMEVLNRSAIDLVLLDIMLPEVDGFEVLKAIRSRQIWLPVIMVTAIGEEEDRIAGLEQGADDYLTKPFSPKELVARVHAVLRRSQLPAPENLKILRFPGLYLDNQQRLAVSGEESLVLTPREFDLLWFLAAHPKQVFTRDQLLDRVWGFDFEGDARTVDVHITRLRRKLQKSGAEETHHYLETVWGHGYRFNPQSAASDG